ncbi:MAG: adenosylcobinamide amidohydrolase [Methanoregula sp.]|jgi:adenosylcobinamide hydrolase|nr:adenosylcobinamide amidohydrolase [Methanoregula sp.]
MRYYSDTNTLFIRGSFRAASTGVTGCIRSVSTLLNHTFPDANRAADPEKVLDTVITASGLERNYFGLTTTVPTGQTCVLQYDFITVFITAGIRCEPPATDGNTNIIIVSSQGMEDTALLEAVMVASEAKAEALQAMDLPLTGTPAEGVIAACEGEGEICHRSAGRDTDAGRRIREAVLHGIPEAVRRHDTGIQDDRPAFFIFSRIKGDHWIEWTDKECPYYPCHFEGQSCEYCYCPFYPCHDEMLGQWATGSNGNRVWNCARCRLPHEPAIAAYLKKYPGASRLELVKRAGSKER